MAHEMGHNFGMTHDSVGCCQESGEDGGCIMAAATGYSSPAIQTKWKCLRWHHLRGLCASFSPRFSHPFPRVFNDCNLKELRSYLRSGGGKCLFNLPNTRVMYGGQRCGNGYLEEGEECDCGEEEVFVVSLGWVFPCVLPCLDACVLIWLNLCRRNVPVPAAMPTTALWELELSVPMVSAAITARYRSTEEKKYHELWIMCPVDHSTLKMCLKCYNVEVIILFILWCHVFLLFLREFSILCPPLSLSVQLKSPGVLCRASSGSCDLPEYCDGRTESCPANFYLVDGTSCAGGQAYCYTGMCLTLEQQCQSLWGQGEWDWWPVICSFKIEYVLIFDDIVYIILLLLFVTCTEILLCNADTSCVVAVRQLFH